MAILKERVRRDIENHFIQVFSPTFNVLEAQPLKFKPHDGFYYGDTPTKKRVREIPSETTPTVQVSTEEEQSALWMAIANAVVNLNGCPYQEQAEIWRAAVINAWFDKQDKVNLATMLDFNENHWLVQTVNYLKHKAEYDKNRGERVGFLYTATYAEAVSNGKIFGRTPDEMQVELTKEITNPVRRWARDFWAWLWDFRELLEFIQDAHTVSDFSRGVKVQAQSIEDESLESQKPIAHYEQTVIPEFQQTLKDTLNELTNDISHDSGFEVIQDMVRVTIACYKDRLIRELNARDEATVPRIQAQINHDFAAFEEKWALLTSEDFRRSLSDFHEALEDEIAKITTKKVKFEKKGDVQVPKNIADPKAIRANIGQVVFKHPKAGTPVVNEFVDAYRKKYYDKLDRAEREVAEQYHIFTQLEKQVNASVDRILAGINPIILDPRKTKQDIAALSKQITDEHRKLTEATNVNGLSDYTRSYIKQWVLSISAKILTASRKVRKYEMLHKPLTDYDTRLKDIVDALKLNVNKANVYEEAVDAWSRNKDSFNVEVDDETYDEILPILEAFDERAGYEISRFGPGFKAELREFKQNLYDSLNAIAGLKNGDLQGIPSQKKKFIDKYQPREDEIGKRSGQFLQERVDEIEHWYMQWVEGIESKTQIGKEFRKLYAQELGRLAKATAEEVARVDVIAGADGEERVDYGKRMLDRFFEASQKIYERFNPEQDPAKHGEYNVVLNHYVQTLDTHLAKRQVELRQRDGDSESLLALAKSKSPRGIEKIIDTFSQSLGMK